MDAVRYKNSPIKKNNPCQTQRRCGASWYFYRGKLLSSSASPISFKLNPVGDLGQMATRGHWIGILLILNNSGNNFLRRNSQVLMQKANWLKKTGKEEKIYIWPWCKWRERPLRIWLDMRWIDGIVHTDWHNLITSARWPGLFKQTKGNLEAEHGKQLERLSAVHRLHGF